METNWFEISTLVEQGKVGMLRLQLKVEGVTMAVVVPRSAAIDLGASLIDAAGAARILESVHDVLGMNSENSQETISRLLRNAIEHHQFLLQGDGSFLDADDDDKCSIADLITPSDN